jgi:uncharacterized protein
MDRPNIDLILMVTLNCNLACDYCYVIDKKVGVMDLSIAKKAIMEIVRQNDPSKATNIYWHGAEPLLAGIDYYREIFAWTRQQFGIDKISHRIQTNGTLLNDDWFNLFIQEHVTTGISLDGPKTIHDTFRKKLDGRGSFDTVFNNILKAREKKLFFDALVVISRATLGHEDELFNFFYENKIEFGFEPIVLANGNNDQELSITPEEYAKIAIRLFDRWFFQPEPRLKMILPLYDFTMSVMYNTNTRCTFSPSCGQHYITIDPEGAVYPCVREPEFQLGDFMKDPIEQILQSNTRLEFLKSRTERISGCNKCNWKNLCNSGCPHNAYSAFGSTLERDSFCTSYKLIFEHVSKCINDGLLGQPVNVSAGIG